MQQLFDALRMTSHHSDNQLQITVGELTAYFPEQHMGTFDLVMHPDDKTGDPVPTGPIPLGSFSTGPGYGAQFTPAIGAQALVIYIDAAKVLPIGAVFLFNEVEAPPWPKGDFSGIVDQYGNALKWSQARSALVAPTKLELGTENLDATQDAVISKRYLDQWWSAQVAQLKTDLASWASVYLQPGHGAPGPTTLNSAASSGSAKVKVAQ
jgi:hypothetical protein